MTLSRPVTLGVSILLITTVLLGGCDFVGEPSGEEARYTQASAAPNGSPSSVLPDDLSDLCTESEADDKRLMCVPPEWNGELVVYAHGWVPPQDALKIPGEANAVLEADESFDVAHTVLGLGYGFATTSYSKNGFAIEQGVEDLADLVNGFRTPSLSNQQPSCPETVYLVGGSEGGLIAALSAEGYGDSGKNVYDGTLATCGPYGSLEKQIRYFADFRVLFDVLLGDDIEGWARWRDDQPQIPTQMINAWQSDQLQPAVLRALRRNPETTKDLIRLSGLAVDTGNPTEVGEAVLGVLRHNILGTNDVISTLGGLPYTNRGTMYGRFWSDWRLNRQVERFDIDGPDETALNKVRDLTTTGEIEMPVMTLHTTEDPIVPFKQQPTYRWKVTREGLWRDHGAFPIIRQGHCNFKPEELLVAFDLLISRVKGSPLPLPAVERVLDGPVEREAFAELRQEFKRETRTREINGTVAE